MSDERFPLSGILVFEEDPAFFLGGEDARDIEVDAAHEDLIAAEVRGVDTQLVEFCMHMGVDVVEVLELGLLIGEVVRDDDGLGSLGVGMEAREEKSLPPVLGCGHPGGLVNPDAVVV